MPPDFEYQFPCQLPGCKGYWWVINAWGRCLSRKQHVAACFAAFWRKWNGGRK